MDEYRNIPVHPIVTAILPLLIILQQNLFEIGPWQIWRSILFSMLIAAAVWAASFSLLRDLQSAALISSLSMALFFAMGRFYGGNVHGLLWELVADSSLIGNPALVVAATLGLFVAGSFALLRLRRYKLGITVFLNIAGISLLTGTVFVIGMREWSLRQPPALGPRLLDTVAETTNAANNPDILIIVLDGYRRSDVLFDLYQYDNSPFLQELGQMGFHTVPNARANYMQTSLSLAAGLNLDYLQDLLRNQDADAQDRSTLLRLIHHSRFAAEMEQAGYADVAVASGYRPTDLRGASRYRDPDSPATNLFERLVIENSGLVLAEAVPKSPHALTHPGYRLHRDERSLHFKYRLIPPTISTSLAGHSCTSSRHIHRSCSTLQAAICSRNILMCCSMAPRFRAKWTTIGDITSNNSNS